MNYSYKSYSKNDRRLGSVPPKLREEQFDVFVSVHVFKSPYLNDLTTTS